MPGRKYSAGSGYRYGFNGKENDNEVKGEGNQQDYGMRIYDPRLGRFLSSDPLYKDYAELSPYQYASDNPVQNIDVDGLEGMAGNLMHPGKYHVAGDANDDGTVDEGERDSWGRMMALNAKLAIYSFFRPNVAIPLLVSEISGVPVTPSPQAMGGSAATQAARQTEVAIEEASSESATVTTGTSGNSLTKANKTTVVQNTSTQTSSANSANNNASLSNTANKPAPSLKTAGGSTINNSKFAGQLNPKAFGKGYNVPVKSNGYPDFDSYLYTRGPGAPGTVQPYNTVNIRMTGTYSGDFNAANQAAGLKTTPNGYTWHHTENIGELKLVQSEVHDAARHSGGVQLYKELNGGKGYN